jgi:acetolactate synthase-1/2/3 large subunit
MPSIADIVVARLRDAGVRFLFGVPGGGSNLDLVDACGRGGVQFVLTATETGGAIAAVAQAEVSRRPGACLTTLGPGVASVVNGVACARLERAPLVVFTDASSADPAHEHQRLDHRALMAPVVKWSTVMAADNAAAVVDEAIACAMSEPCGPVHIDCPGDAFTKATGGTRGAGSVGSSDSARVGLALADAPQARKPLLLVGLGARAPATAAAIRALCASRRIPAMVTYKAKGVVPDTHPWFAGVFTNGAIERAIVQEADLLVTIGLDAVELLPRPWTYSQPLLALAPSDVPGFGDAVHESSWDAASLQSMRAAQRASVCASGAGLTPDRVVTSVADRARHCRVTVDAGAHMFAATMLWPIDEPNGMLISNGLSTMGFALPAAIGAALLDRERPPDAVAAPHPRPRTIALTGDGGLLMCAGELVTVAREQLDIVVVVFNDAALSLIEIKQMQRRLARSGVDIGGVDWRALAESVGLAADRAETADDLSRALDAALARRGPSVIDVRIDSSGYAVTLKAIRG